MLRTAQEAYFVAQEMEKRAIRLYERAAMLFGGDDIALARLLSSLTGDEREHLCAFTRMGEGVTPGGEGSRVLSAGAADILFAGGLVEADRERAFDSPADFLRYAAREEETSAARYRALAAEAVGAEAADALERIAREEDEHLHALRERLREYEK